MFSLLLRKALPFALAFVVGTAAGTLFKSRGRGPLVWAWPGSATPLLGREVPFGAPRWRGHDHCRMRRYSLVAETRPLVFLFKPDARRPRASEGYGDSVRVSVTFGADGKVQKVEQLEPFLPGAMLEAAERAAWQIQFLPETVDSRPVPVTREVEINFGAE